MPARPTKPASYPVSVRQVAVLLHASFRHHLAGMPLRFANPSPPSGWIEDFHFPATEHAGHTTRSRETRAISDRGDKMVRTRLNIGCRYSTPVRKRPLHPTRGHFTPEPSQTQAPVTPATEPERRAGGSLTTDAELRRLPDEVEEEGFRGAHGMLRISGTGGPDPLGGSETAPYGAPPFPLCGVQRVCWGIAAEWLRRSGNSRPTACPPKICGEMCLCRIRHGSLRRRRGSGYRRQFCCPLVGGRETVAPSGARPFWG